MTGLPAVANPTGVRGWLHVGRGDLADNAAWPAGRAVSVVMLAALMPASNGSSPGHAAFALAVVAGIGLARPRCSTRCDGGSRARSTGGSIGLGADLTGVVDQVLAPEQVSLWLS